MSQINKNKYECGPKSFGMTARTSFVDQGDKTIPGPGTHINYRMNKFNPPEYKIGNATQRDTFLDKFHFPNPASSDYNPKFQATKTKNPMYSIPQSNSQHQKKHFDQNNALLYNPNYNCVKNNIPKYTMSFFQQRDYRTDVPPPNLYDLNQTKTNFNKAQHTFTISNRPLPYGQHAKWPGAGNYFIQKVKPNTYQYSIGTSQRPQVNLGKDSPAKFYDISSSLKKPGAGKTFGSIYYPKQKKNQVQFPGPNQYNPHDLEHQHNILIPYSNRIPLQNTAILKYPSPQKYSTQQQFYKKKSLSFTKDIRDRIHFNQNPGPGTHEVKAQLSSRSGIMGRKLKETVQLITPAADHYSPNKQFIKQSSPRVINYYSNRVDFSKSLTGQKIGPGSYQVDKSARAQLGKMSKSMKFGIDYNKNPGPGSYYIPSTIGRLPKYYTANKKLTHQGYSTLTVQMWQKMRKQKIKKQQIQREKEKEKEIQQNMTNSQNL